MKQILVVTGGAVIMIMAFVIHFSPTNVLFAEAYTKKIDKDPSKIRYEQGGLLVTNTFECLDQMLSCREQVDDDPEACEEGDEEDEDELRSLCPVACGVCERTTKLADKRMTIGIQQKNDGTFGERQGVDTVLQEMIQYLKEEVMVDVGYSDMYKECQNKNKLCSYWAAKGECQSNPGYMQKDCMLSCKSCDKHHKYNKHLEL